jgi:hypothetical protein
MTTVSYYLYGKDAAAIVRRDTPKWTAWMAQHYPMPQGKS